MFVLSELASLRETQKPRRSLKSLRSPKAINLQGFFENAVLCAVATASAIVSASPHDLLISDDFIALKAATIISAHAPEITALLLLALMMIAIRGLSRVHITNRSNKGVTR